jgi:2-aminoethylphosphonate-pyruvate transaminase
MNDFFYTRGFTIYTGKIESLHTFRVANIGDITYKDVEAFLKLLEEYLIFIGFNVDDGTTVTKIDRMGAEQ